MELNQESKVNILEAMHMQTAAWNSVTPETISVSRKQGSTTVMTLKWMQT
jgi:hypothetical protein